MEALFYIFLIVLLLMSSAYCSGTEAALFSLPTTRLKSYKNSKDERKKIIAHLLFKPRDLLVTIFMLNTLVNILLQNVSANLFGDLSSWSLKVGVPLVLTLVFGEILPKYVGLQRNIEISHGVAPSIQFLQNLLGPIRKATIAITEPISRVLFFYLKKEEDISSDEMEHILKTSEEFGIFNAEEGELIAGYLELQKSSVKEIMHPREDILYYNIEEPISKLNYLFAEKECSRIPVCKRTVDNVLGIVDVSDFLKVREILQNPKDLIPFLKKPFYVLESINAPLLLKRFHERNEVLALVVDEYGTLSGLITREDLFEVVVGEISDLRDQAKLYTRSGENEIITSGKLELSEFEDIFKVTLESKYNMVTIGGYLTEKLGEIPKSGTQVEIESFLFKILSATPNRIKRIYIRKLPLKKN